MTVERCPTCAEWTFSKYHKCNSVWLVAIVEGEEIRITAVEENNQLIVRATPGQYEAIRGAIRKLDAVPLQVHIEARLLDVSLTNNLQYGVKWYFEDALERLQPPEPSTGGGTAKGLDLDDTFGEITSEGVNWIFAGRNSGALVQLLQSEGDVKVLSAPSVLVLNNTEASINVGTQIPVVSSYFNPITQPGGGSTVGQSQVQFRDTGIILNVKPRVNPGGLVFMEIKAEQSAPGTPSAATAASGNLPVDKKTIETEVAVQSGDTVLLGGLIQQNDTNSQSGFPGLMKIPLLGRLFGNTKRDNSRKELLVLITPTVIRGGAEDADRAVGRGEVGAGAGGDDAELLAGEHGAARLLADAEVAEGERIHCRAPFACVVGRRLSADDGVSCAGVGRNDAAGCARSRRRRRRRSRLRHRHRARRRRRQRRRQPQRDVL